MSGHLGGLRQPDALAFALPTVDYACDLPPTPTRSGGISSATVTEAGSDASIVIDYDYDALGRALDFTYDAYGSLPTGVRQYYYGARLYEPSLGLLVTLLQRSGETGVRQTVAAT
jgi:hypothetical protein